MTSPEDIKKSEIRNWWADNPMTYGDIHGKTTYDTAPSSLQIGTREFFESADRRFYSWNQDLHSAEGPFTKLFNFKKYKGKKVLEIGCGMGCMAMNWAQQGATVSAVDLNPVAIEQTKKRFHLFNLQATIQEMDGRSLDFPDNYFDYVYSWGVLHHSPDLQRSIDEVLRVLKPGGRTGVMLYHRNSLLYFYTVKYLEGFLHLENRFLTEIELASRYGDGDREEGNPYTWPITKKEAFQIFKKFSHIKTTILGSDIEYSLDLAFPRLGSWIIPKALRDALGRRWGWSLWIQAQKD